MQFAQQACVRVDKYFYKHLQILPAHLAGVLRKSLRAPKHEYPAHTPRGHPRDSLPATSAPVFAGAFDGILATNLARTTCLTLRMHV